MVAALNSTVFASGLSKTSARMLDAAGSHIHSNTTQLICLFAEYDYIIRLGKPLPPIITTHI